MSRMSPTSIDNSSNYSWHDTSPSVELSFSVDVLQSLNLWKISLSTLSFFPDSFTYLLMDWNPGAQAIVGEILSRQLFL